MTEEEKTLRRLRDYLKNDAFYTRKAFPKNECEKEQLKHCYELKLMLDEFDSQSLEIKKRNKKF